MSTLHVLIGEANPYVRAGLVALLGREPGIEPSVGLDAAPGRLADAPMVALLSRSAADREALARLTEHGVPTLVLVDRLREHELTDLLAGGARGLLAHRDDPSLLPQALHALADGEELWLSPRVAGLLMTHSRLRTATRLTPRERSILCAMALGLPNPSIAQSHNLSVGTVRNVVSALYTKLGVASRAEAIAWAWRNGLIEPSTPRPRCHADS